MLIEPQMGKESFAALVDEIQAPLCSPCPELNHDAGLLETCSGPEAAAEAACCGGARTVSLEGAPPKERLPAAVHSCSQGGVPAAEACPGSLMQHAYGLMQLCHFSVGQWPHERSSCHEAVISNHCDWEPNSWVWDCGPISSGVLKSAPPCLTLLTHTMQGPADREADRQQCQRRVVDGEDVPQSPAHLAPTAVKMCLVFTDTSKD